MTDVLQMTDPTSIHQQRLMHNPHPHPSITSTSSQPPLLLAPSTGLAAPANDVPQPVKDDLDGEEDDGVIACICAFNTDDGNTIQCDKCMRWQHILCYYPPPEPTPDEASAHYCLDCLPRHLDARKATERQRKALNEQDTEQQSNKKPPTKSHKKKARDSPSISNTPLIGSDKHEQTALTDTKSVHVRDAGPPAAKRPKIAHKSSDKPNNPAGRKRRTNSTNNTPVSGTRSQSPDTLIPQYSNEFLRLFKSNPPQVDTATNLMNDIGITNALSEWLVDSKAVSKATRGLTPGDIFQRWPGRIEDIPGCPEISVRWVEDPRFTSDGLTPRWAQVVIEDQIAPGAFIGELRGRISHIDHYHAQPDNRWQYLRHPIPFVFFHPQLPICIDARQEGSIFRFVRRSCNPNSKLQTIITEGNEYHFCFMALRDIMPGEEISIAWSVPESISEKIKTSFGQTNNVQPNVREAICDWVSKVLANCGPCACAGPAHCLMSHYDRRGQPLPKLRKGKKARLSQVDAGADQTRSRSASETIYKNESYDEASGGPANSATPGSDSRDMTPHPYELTSAGGTLLPEMSERERKKLMREEEMFRKQEQANDKQRKKRPSGGSNLNTPLIASPVRGRGSIDMVDGPVRRSTGDLATIVVESRPSLGKRKADHDLGTRRNRASSTRQAVYADASVQCDMDQDADQAPCLRVPKRKYISLKQRLLRQCTFNNQERRASLTIKPAMPSEQSSDAMALDVKQSLMSGPVTKSGSEGLAERYADKSSTVAPAPITGGSRQDGDSAMPDVMANGTADADSSPRSVVFNPSVNSALPSAALEMPPAEHLSPAPSPLARVDVTTAIAPEPAAPIPVTASNDPGESIPVTALTEPAHEDMDPVLPSTTLHVEPQATESASSDPIPTSEPLDAQAPLPLPISPNVTATLAPSPIRKKLSLKDYTKRSKAKPGVGEITPGGILTPSSGLTADPTLALLSTESNLEQPGTSMPPAAEQINDEHVKSEQS